MYIIDSFTHCWPTPDLFSSHELGGWGLGIRLRSTKVYVGWEGLTHGRYTLIAPSLKHCWAPRDRWTWPHEPSPLHPSSWEPHFYCVGECEGGSGGCAWWRLVHVYIHRLCIELYIYTVFMLTGLHLGEGGICPPCQNFVPHEICKGYVRYENKTSDAPPQSFQPSTFALSWQFFYMYM